MIEHMQGMDAIKVALRVLTAITQDRHPAAKDVEELYRLAPEGTYQTLDEVACAVVQNALERARTKLRAGSA